LDIIRAKSAGFCFGVSRAVKTVNELIENRSADHKIYILGNLIHNQHFVNSLKERGVVTISESDIQSVFENTSKDNKSIVVMRTHGVTKDVEDLLMDCKSKNPYFFVVDCTCPFVKKIHKIASSCVDENCTFVVMGDENHPEVKGIVSRSGTKSLVISDSESAKETNFGDNKLIIVSQTTQNLDEWNKSKKYFKEVFTFSQIFDTICYATDERQKEAGELAASVDLMLIIGDTGSSNTAKLFDVAKRTLDNTFLIRDASEIPYDALHGVSKIGITAGASTPGHIIEEVEKKMSEVIKNGENFAELYEEFEQNQKKLHKGEIVTGTITSISSTEIHVDLSTKVTGILSITDAMSDIDADVHDVYKVGDSIEVFVVRVSDVEGVAGLSMAPIKRQNAWKKIVEAAANDEVLEGKIIKAVNGGVIIAIGESQMFIPAGQSGVPRNGDLSSLVGTTQQVMIIDINEDKKRAVASIKKVQSIARKAVIEQFWNNIEVGKKYTGTVKSLTSYGAFVDLGGVDGMVHVTELTWDRIKKPEDVVTVGQQIEVFVKSFDAEKKNHISLTCKTDESNPWNIFTTQFKVGDVASVKVVSIVPFGAFAEIVPNVDGLIHISEIADKKLASPAEVLHVGDVVEALIKGIDEEKKQVALSIRALIAPTEEVEETEEAPEEVLTDAEAEV